MGWAEMICKVYEVDPMACPKCGGTIKIIDFITEYAVVDRIIDHLKLTFVAAKPPAVPCLRAGFAHGVLQGKSGFSPHVQTVFTRGEVRLLSI